MINIPIIFSILLFATGFILATRPCVKALLKKCSSALNGVNVGAEKKKYWFVAT